MSNTTNTTADHRSLYEVTGDIKDINTLLVPRAALASPAQAGEYPELPVPLVLESGYGPGDVPDAYTADQMRAYVDADRAARKPLADSELHALYADEMAEYFVDALHYWKGTSAHQYARAIENAHGIKATNQESNK